MPKRIPIKYLSCNEGGTKSVRGKEHLEHKPIVSVSSYLVAQRIFSCITCFDEYIFSTNRDDALTTKGVIQVEDACADMMLKDINPSVVKYSLASKCIDTANIVATRMMVCFPEVNNSAFKQFKRAIHS